PRARPDLHTIGVPVSEAGVAFEMFRCAEDELPLQGTAKQASRDDIKLANPVESVGLRVSLLDLYRVPRPLKVDCDREAVEEGQVLVTGWARERARLVDPAYLAAEGVARKS